MGAARRLYVYVVSAVSLLALAIGIGTLLTTLFAEINDALGASAMGGWGLSREQLSLSLALIVVGLPVWLFHWWVASRGLRGTGPQAEEERRSAARAWYLTVVLAVSGGVLLVASMAFGGWAFGVLLDAKDMGTWPGPLATILVALPVWGAHFRMRGGEIRSTRMSGAVAWTARLYRYAGTFVSLLVLVFGAAGLIGTILSVIVGRPDFGLDDTWWRAEAAVQLAAIVAGAAGWLLHWRDAQTAIRDAEVIGEDDRVTRLRAVYFGAVLLVMTAFAAFAWASAIADLGRWILGAIEGDTLRFLEFVVAPPVTTIPLAVAAAWHVRFHAREAAGMGGRLEAAAVRLTRHLVSLVGLAFLTAGSAQLIALGLETSAGASGGSVLWDGGGRNQLPWYVAQLVVGLALWVPSWTAIARVRALDPAGELAAPAARAYLYLVIGAAVVLTVPSAVYLLYRALDTVLGGSSAQPLLAELALPIGAVLVALVTGTYHGRLLAADRRAVAASTAPAGEDTGRALNVPPAVADARATVAPVALLLEAPADTDVDALVASLRGRLPPGATLTRTAGIPGR